MSLHLFQSRTSQDPSRKPTKLSSPSYTKTSQNLFPQSNFPHHQSNTPNTNHPQTIPKTNKSHSNHHSDPSAQSKHSTPPHPLTIDNIKWINDKALFTSELQLQVQYTVSKRLTDNISWQVRYFGSAFTQNHDQVLMEFETEQNDECSSFPEKRQFKLSVQPPKWHLISPPELFATTAVTISAFYKGQEFVKVGYYVHYQVPELTAREKECVWNVQKEGKDEEKQDKKENFLTKSKGIKKSPKSSCCKCQCDDRETQGKILQGVLGRTVRTILGDKPRIVRFEIDWQKQDEEFNNELEPQSQSTGVVSKQHLITEYMRSNKAGRQ